MNHRHLEQVTLACLFLFVAFTSALFAEGQSQKNILVLAPMTGNLAEIGETMRAVVTLADEKYDRDNRVNFLIEDHQYQPTKALSALNAAQNQTALDGVIIFGSGPSIALAPVAEKLHIPMIGVAIADSFARNRVYIKRMFCSVPTQAQQLLQEAQRRKYGSVAIITLQNDALIRLKDEFEKNFSGTIISSKEVDPGNLDFRALAVNIAHLHPDAVLLLLLPPNHSLAAQELRRLGYAGDFFASAPVQSRTELERDPTAVEGLWFATCDDRQSSDLRAEVRSRFGFEAHPDGLFAFDAAKHFIQSTGGESVGLFQKNVDYEGVFGRYQLSSENSFDIPSTVKIVHNGAFEALEEQ